MRETDRQADRQTDRQTETDREPGRQTDSQRQRQRNNAKIHLEYARTATYELSAVIMFGLRSNQLVFPIGLYAYISPDDRRPQ